MMTFELSGGKVYPVLVERVKNSTNTEYVLDLLRDTLVEYSRT
jgi:hypothetical protein